MSLPIRIPDLVPRLRELAPAAPGEKELWVLLPSFALLRELSQTLLDDAAGWVGVRLMSADMAVQHILESRGNRPAGIMDPLAQADLLLQVLRELRTEKLPDGQARELEYLLRFPETRHGLLRALTLMRSHGWAGEQALPLCTDTGRLLAATLGRFHAKLQQLGLLDRRDLLDQAVSALSLPCDTDPAQVLIFAPGPRLSGELEALWEALEDRIPVEIHTQALAPPTEGEASLQERALHFGESTIEVAPALPQDRFSMYTAQGELEELREALQRARAHIQAGCAPHRIGLVLSDPRAYARHLSRLAIEEGLPLEPGFGRALRDHPMASLTLRLIRMLDGDLPRRILLSCLGHPHFGREDHEYLLRRENLAWLDRITREEGCLGTRAGLMDGLVRRREQMLRRKVDATELEHVNKITDQLDALLLEFEDWSQRLKSASSHHVQVEELSAFVTMHVAAIDDEETAFRETLLQAFEVLSWRDKIGLPVLDLPGLVTHLEEILAQELARHPCYRAGGIRLLSLDRFRGLELDHVFLLGFNRGRYPRRADTDLWITETDRQALREDYYSGDRTVAPGLFPSFEVGEDNKEIQIQDLASLIGGAKQSFTLSWLRADAAGKQKSPSAWLRLFGRALAGTDLQAELEGEGRIHHLPWSPQRRLAYRYAECRPLSANEALCLAAFQGADAALLETASLIGDPRADGLQQASTERSRLDSFEIAKDPEALSWDALSLSSPTAAASSLSVSAFEALGRCPLSFYLGNLLNARPLPEEPLLDGIRMRDLGSALHDVLNKLFGEAKREGLLEGDLPAAFDHMRDRISIEVLHHQRRLLSELSRSLEAVKPEYLQSWMKSLEDLLGRDLAELMESGYRPSAFEEKISTEIQLGGGRVSPRPVKIHGRMDRLDRDAQGRERVLDYKSGGTFKPDDKEIKIDPFQGKKLQLPLYMLLLRELSPEMLPAAELRGIAPDALERCRGSLPTKRFSDQVMENEESLRERLGILHELLMQGNFPFHKDHHCNFCDFRHGCPRHHRPTQERQESWEPLEDYREMQKVSALKLLGQREGGLQE
jgi:RecB family exonuclease